MKKIATNKGWNEVTTEVVEITLLVNKPFSTAGSWVELTRKRPTLNKGGKNHCQFCNIKWVDINPEALTFFAHTTKGNKIFCEECFKEFSTNSEIKRV